MLDYIQRNYTRPERVLIATVLSVLITLLLTTAAFSARIKDIASFKGVRSNQLVGYGLVVGLQGTGDRRGAEFTIRSMVNMLERMGVSVDADQLRPANVAAVMVTAKMPVSARPGSSLDISVSSLGDSESLLGGTLLMTPMKGVDGKVYALAQGALAVGGFSVGGEAAQAQQNIATNASIPGGATVERGIPFQFNDQDTMTMHLSVADFSTTMQVVNTVNRALGGDFARAEDISTVSLDVPPSFRNNLVPLMASIENLEVRPDQRARVVVDEKTGTIVMGQNVRLSRVAIAHGNLQVVISEDAEVSQPEAFSAGQTVVVPQTDLAVQEENRRLMLAEGATLQELVDGLNAIGATPRDMISILRTLKRSGALMAELEVV